MGKYIIPLEIVFRQVNLERLRSSRILITGASGLVGGYLGNSLVSAFIESGVYPEQLFLTYGDRPASFSDQIRDVNFARIGSLGEAIEQGSRYPFDFVIHAASSAIPSVHMADTNLSSVNEGFIRKLFQSQDNPKRLLYLSSGEVYSKQQTPVVLHERSPVGDFVDQSRSRYPNAKLEGEVALLEFGKKFDCQGDLKVARLFHTFGPGIRREDSRSFSSFIWSARDEKKVLLQTSGAQIRTFLYLPDAANALLRIMLDDSSESVYNVGSAEPVSILEFARIVAEVSDSLLIEEPYPNLVQSPNFSLVPDVTKLGSLGWTQEFTLWDSILETYEWTQAK